MNDDSIFWLNDIHILYKNNNYIKFYPKFEYSREEQLNAITRACIYFIVISMMFGNDEQYLYVPVIIIVLCVILFKIHENDIDKGKKEVTKVLDERKKKIIHNNKPKKITNNFINADEEIDDNDTTYDDNDSKDESIPVESLYTAEEIQEFNENTCKIPTKDNPFMNPSLNDYNNGDIPVACNSDDENIHDKITKNYDDKLFKNLDDLWDQENSQRQFYTVPSTSVPSKQKEFANFLYKTDKTCKENKENCLRYEDLRFKR